MRTFIYNIQGVMEALVINPHAQDQHPFALNTLPAGTQRFTNCGNSVTCGDNKLTKSALLDMRILTATDSGELH